MTDTTNTPTPPNVGGPVDPDVGGPVDPDASPYDPRLLIGSIRRGHLAPGANDSLVDATRAGATVWPVQIERTENGVTRREWGITAEAPGGRQGSCRITPESFADLAACVVDGERVLLRGVPQKLVKSVTSGKPWAQLEADISDEPTPDATSIR